MLKDVELSESASKQKKHHSAEVYTAIETERVCVMFYGETEDISLISAFQG